VKLRGLLHGVTELDVLFGFYVTVASLFFVVLIYDFAAAWFAPACVSARELGWWCLPIGFEGPFGDLWANRSFFNARVAATADLIVVGLAFFCAVYVSVQRHKRSRAIAYCCGLVAIMVLVVKGFILNDPS
jgi:hypothetical protein